MKSPAFQWYPGDYLGSQRVQLLTLEEEGAYMRLLCYCWLHGSIPSEPEQIARLIGKGASTTLATKVSTMFQPNGARLVHDRLESERRKQSDWREKSSAGGRKSAEKRAYKRSQTIAHQSTEQGSLANGANQSPTLQSSVFSLQSSDISPSPAGKGGKAANDEPPDPRHREITRRWGELFQGAFGVSYGFDVKDAATLKRFLKSVKVPAEEILTVAVQAWERSKQDRYAKRCKDAATLHGLCTYFNDIRVELQTPGSITNNNEPIGKRSSFA